MSHPFDGPDYAYERKCIWCSRIYWPADGNTEEFCSEACETATIRQAAAEDGD